ncbi:MAG: branched-chain amino acid ABC transporter permease [Alphaproteobacteria bacterium]|nr:branched-chain amino acid ABC transporter permease [Alphaproteobacteria bacterium]MDA7983739.1 branched-chain amino acid ABC transporter permease [Alphaproteobacteria bacterium]MDA7987683.1 branched-chain amino acid ABC transporter permease [Alphaproteobacteria bacterium]MDA7988631.1 branched-chain amino acid ABC transporter permease [Alphaproteobacteria bacterium]MDA8000794.1 branched-chain amino acid ABC transporter permease [Alphaproteobacteria bacterium]
MSLSLILLQLVNGVHYGLLLFLVAGGLSLIFGLLGVINLAHGSFYMFGAWIVWWATTTTGNYWFALAAVVIFVAAGAWVLERAVYRRVYESSPLVHVLLTYGLALLLDELRSALWDDEVHSLAAPESLRGFIDLGEGLPSYPLWRVFVSLLCLCLALGLWWLSARTRLGAAVRAGVERREMAEGLGLNTPRLFSCIFILGAVLAAVSGALAAPISSVYPGLDSQALILSFVVVVVGGVGSLSGAFVAALLLGVADTFGRTFLPEAASVAVYVVMFAVLVWRPEGVLASRR